MDIWPPKQPAEIVAYPIDWRPFLGSGGPYGGPNGTAFDGDPIETYTLTVTSGDAVIDFTQNNWNLITALISGGTTGTTTEFLNVVTTAAGQVLDRTISLLVQDNSVPYAPQTATKRLVINMAYDEVRMAVPEFQVNPNELNTALLKLDILMAEWAVSGIYLGYNQPTIPGDGDLDDAIGIPNATLHSVALYLALRISPAFGKSLSKETSGALVQAMSNLRAMSARIPNMRYPRTTPLGQGNRWWLFNNFPFASSSSWGG